MEHETDYSPPSSAEVKNVWSYTTTPPYVFMMWYLVMIRDNFTFTLTSHDNKNTSHTLPSSDAML
jgi:hypothetical protein